MAVQNGDASSPPPASTLPAQIDATSKVSGERDPLLPPKPATKDAAPAVRGQRFGLASFIEDTQDVTSGTLPISVLIATAVGVVCGIVAWAYYSILEFLLDLIWSVLPDALLVQTTFPPALYWTWIPFIGLLGAVGVGLSVRLLGEPGDLASTVANVHGAGFVHMSHAVPMFFASQFSILGGGSLGPEAPLVAICACMAGWLSRTVFGQKYKNVIRKHTLMGMACALAAFFGVPLGGSLFALEINSRLGYEYFEHALEAILSGTVCLMVFRGLAGLEIGPIYKISPVALGPSSSGLVLTGAFIGLLGAAVAFLFARGHRWLMGQFRAAGLMEDPLKRSLVGGLGIVVIGVFIPQTLFWGEFEFQTIASGTPAESLVHVFPTSGLMGWEITSFTEALVTGLAKLVAISFTVAGGYRGGFIFPFFMAGASFGRAFVALFPSVSPIIACLCFAAGINVSITRTSLATTLILTALSGEVNAGPPLLAASLVAVFATSYMPFIGSQQAREDMEESQFFSYADVNAKEVPEDDENEHV